MNNEVAIRPEIPAELMNFWRENLKEELHELMKDTIKEQVDAAASSALLQVQQQAEKLKDQITRQENTINLYKRDVKSLQQEVSSMAHKNVAVEETQFEKDKKIALLEKRIAEMELERVTLRLDDLDKQAKNRRDISLLKAAVITIATGGLGVHTLISEATDEAIIRHHVKDGQRYHKAAQNMEDSNKRFASLRTYTKTEDSTQTIGHTY